MQRIVALMAGLFLLAGCGSDEAPVAGSAGAPSTAAQAQNQDQGQAQGQEHNDVDVMFLQMAVPHHRQGLELARLAKERAVRPDVKTLAAAIESTQQSEVDSMTKWLADWGKPETAPDAQLHAAHGGDHSTKPEFIAEVAGKTGAEFERDFLNLMIAHQHNAVEIAKLEREGGLHPPSKELAERIFQSRTAQISQMLGFLG
ncbi:uncharacterized protein (DUF305 family) [Saccharothrix coeruleofusca]|uniref:DUF305 domain-containing protein n=1 Tax=Saccharothrix coeruleofusca TaxID=33919 RepID=UPI0027DBEB82|nr:DUF305 domain-containing protein [Saccharothrix coeruleofusca]MBP2337937.1 uncharacterized protein (DUF305 family) [Saccharothrix coeruleofusca]